MAEVTIRRSELGAEGVVGAILWSILLYPDEQEADRRAAFCAALVAGSIAAEPDPDRRAETMAWLPAPVDIDPAAVKFGLKGSRRRARDRLVAGWMLLQRLGIGVRPSGAAPPSRRPSIEALAERALRWSGESRADNLIKRLWSQSRPVLHLAAAFQFAASQTDVGEGEWGNATLDDPALNERIVTLAGEIEGHILADPSLSSWSDSLIRLTLVEIND